MSYTDFIFYEITRDPFEYLLNIKVNVTNFLRYVRTRLSIRGELFVKDLQITQTHP